MDKYSNYYFYDNSIFKLIIMVLMVGGIYTKNSLLNIIGSVVVLLNYFRYGNSDKPFFTNAVILLTVITILPVLYTNYKLNWLKNQEGYPRFTEFSDEKEKEHKNIAEGHDYYEAEYKRYSETSSGEMNDIAPHSRNIPEDDDPDENLYGSLKADSIPSGKEDSDVSGEPENGNDDSGFIGMDELPSTAAGPNRDNDDGNDGDPENICMNEMPSFDDIAPPETETKNPDGNDDENDENTEQTEITGFMDSI